MSKPYSQSGEKGTDTNQASEDELMRQLGFRYEPSEGGHYIHKFVKNPENPSSLNSVLVPEVAKQIQARIRTEKLKLLDEVIHQSTINLKSAKAVAGWAELRKEHLEAGL